MTDQSDRELLERSAMAAGIEWQSYHMSRGLCLTTPKGGMVITQMWNPLADDGDALRLAVKLNLVIECMVGQSAARTFDSKYAGCVDHADSRQYPKRDFSPDLAAATRRSIVLAAAAMAPQTGD